MLEDMAPTLDATLRGATGGILLLTALLFAREHRRLAARFGIALALCALVELVGESPWRLTASPDVLFAGTVVSSFAIPLFWMFSRAWFDDAFRPSWRDAALAVGFVALQTWRASLAPGGPGTAFAAVSVATYVAGTGFAAHALRLVWRDREGDLVEPRRRVRAVFVIAVALFIVWALWSEAVGLLTAEMPHWRLSNSAALLSVALLVAVSLFGLREADTFPIPHEAPVEPPPADPVDPRLADALGRLMSHDRIYREEGLTIGAIAGRLGVPDYRVRQLINKSLGYRNFNEYLNAHRLAEVRDALADPAQAEVPIVTVALDSGFGSLASFNRAFKAATGETPSAYRRGRADVRA